MAVIPTVIDVPVTPEQLATAFSEMCGDEQAIFFDALKPITDKWPGAGWCQQSSDIAGHLTDSGREIIAKLAEWAADPSGEKVA